MTAPLALLRRYGPLGGLRLLRDLAFTRCYGAVRGFRPRLIRLPFYVRGIDRMRIGPGLTSGVGLRLDAFPPEPGSGSAARGPCLTIGADVQVNDYVHIAAIEDVTIGDRVLIASKVFVSDHDHGAYGEDRGAPHEPPTTPPAARRLVARPVAIGDDVWLGENVAVLAGARIGRGAVVGANSVVTGEIPPESVAVGAPARVVRTWNEEARRWQRT